MNQLKDYLNYIVNSHMYEKFIINHMNGSYINDYKIKKVNISFTMPPENAHANPFSVLVHKMFLEQITGQKLQNHQSEKHINEFDLKKDQYIGSSTTLRNHMMYHFLSKLIFLNQTDIYNLHGFIEKTNLKNNTFSIGLKTLDAFEPVRTTFEKWALMPDHFKYGCYIHIINNYENNLLNEILYSHLGLKIL